MARQKKKTGEEKLAELPVYLRAMFPGIARAIPKVSRGHSAIGRCPECHGGRGENHYPKADEGIEMVLKFIPAVS